MPEMRWASRPCPSRLLRRCAPRNDNAICCHCEQSEAISVIRFSFSELHTPYEDKTMSKIKALVHDVFGTVVDWRSAVTADGEALGARKGITGVDWQQFADEWRGAYAPSM